MPLSRGVAQSGLDWLGVRARPTADVSGENNGGFVWPAQEIEGRDQEHVREALDQIEGRRASGVEQEPQVTSRDARAVREVAEREPLRACDVTQAHRKHVFELGLHAPSVTLEGDVAFPYIG